MKQFLLYLSLITCFLVEPLLSTHSSYAQSSRVADSLSAQLAASASDTLRVYIYLELFNEYQHKELQKAKEFAQKALDLSTSINFETGKAKSYNAIGDIHQYWGEYHTAMEYYLEGLAINEANQDKMGISNDYNSLGVINDLLGNSEIALKYYRRSYDLKHEIGDKKGMGVALNNMAITYGEQGDISKATECFLEAKKLYEEIDDQLRLSDIFNNLGETYNDLKNFEKGLEFGLKGLKIKREIGDLRGTAASLCCIGQANTGLGNLEAAEEAYSEAIEISRQSNNKYFEYGALGALADVYESQNDYKKSLQYFKEYLKVKEEVVNESNLNEVSKLLSKYESEKKEQKIALLHHEKALQESELRNKTLTQKLLTGAIGLLLIFAYVGFRQHRAKQERKRQMLSDQLKLEKSEAERLQEMDRLKARFFANIAHEFRTPLTLIMGPAATLLEKVEHPEHKAELSLIQQHSGKLLRLINQLLDLSKLESGMVKPQLIQDDIIPFLKGLTYSFESLSEQKNISLHFLSTEENLWMDFDPDLIEKIMFNLLSNAFKFTPPSGTIEVMITKSRKEKNDESLPYLEVKLKDSGTGIPADQLTKVFDRFFQADNAGYRGTEGSGIGLALTKELVEISGGTISAKSEREMGTEFTFYLPIRNESSKPANAEQLNNSSLVQQKPLDEESLCLINTGAQPSEKEIILVIEDHPAVRNFICNSLKSSYQIIEATNGVEGIELANAHIPDLIISDVMMPGKDGYETCKTLKEQESTSHIPVILLTAKAGMENKLEGLETGADDFLAKPFNIKELLIRIKNLINSRKSLRNKYLLASKEEALPAIEPVEDEFLKKIRCIVEQHLDDETFSVEDLSKELAMSRTQVHRKLKALTNQSASQFMRIIKLQHAKELLMAGKANVSEVAFQVGFGSPTYFSTCYTEFFGYPPSELKKKIAPSQISVAAPPATELPKFPES